MKRKNFIDEVFPFKEATKEGEREIIILIIFSIILFVSSLVVANWILPKNCFLFSSNILHPQACHTIPMPNGCEPCNRAAAAVASIIAGLGLLGSIFVPILIFVIKNSRKRPIEQPKLFN